MIQYIHKKNENKQKNKRIITTPLVKCTCTDNNVGLFFRSDPNPLQNFQTFCNSVEGCLIQSPFFLPSSLILHSVSPRGGQPTQG